MKIALFYPHNLYAGWYAQGGYVNTLKRMGHEVINAWVPGNQPQLIEQLREKLPTIEQLNTCDVILSMYHEYMTPWLEALYGFENWQRLTTPVIARFDESFDRPDLLLGRRWDEMKRWAHHFSFPAEQDAKKYHGQWSPFGTDEYMFNQIHDSPDRKKHDIGFIGSPYPIRQDYLKRLSEHLPNTITFKWGQCLVQDLDGIKTVESTQLLAENYRQLKIFFCLPPMSKLIVAKIPDIIRCGTFVMYPKLPWHARKNMEQFVDGKHIVYYDPGYLGQNAEQIQYYLEHEEEREAIADAGREHARLHWTLEMMMIRILSLAKISCSSQERMVGAVAEV